MAEHQRVLQKGFFLTFFSTILSLSGSSMIEEIFSVIVFTLISNVGVRAVSEILWDFALQGFRENSAVDTQNYGYSKGAMQECNVLFEWNFSMGLIFFWKSQFFYYEKREENSFLMGYHLLLFLIRKISPRLHFWYYLMRGAKKFFIVIKLNEGNSSFHTFAKVHIKEGSNCQWNNAHRKDRILSRQIVHSSLCTVHTCCLQSWACKVA